MTPLQINMLLHFHCIAEPWPRLHAPACMETVQHFLNEGLIKTDEAYGAHGSGFTTTERGNALVNHLCAVQYPVAVWVQPPRLTQKQA
jgi:hypothetical protein